MAEEEGKMSASQSDQMSHAVAGLLDSVFCDVDSNVCSQKVDNIINKQSMVANDSKFCPRAVDLEKTYSVNNPETNNGISPENIPIQRSQGDTQIDEVGQQLTEEGYCNESPADYLPDDSCPLYFRSEDTNGHESEESFETLDIRNINKQHCIPAGYDDEFTDEAIFKLKRELLGSEESEEDELDESTTREHSILSSPILNQLKSPKKISDQERQNILNTLMHGAEKKVRQRQKAQKLIQSDQAKDTKVVENGADPNPVFDHAGANSETQQNPPEMSSPNHMEETEAYLDEGTSHIRESLLSVLEALKYVFQSAQIEREESGGTEEPPGSPAEGATELEDGDSRNHFTQTSPRLGRVGDERVDADLFIAGLQEEFQRCLWIHQKLTEEAHQMGFDRGIQNALFLQDLIDQSVHLIWSLREERRQVEKYMKDKERDWNTMSRGLTQEVIDLRRENVQMLTALASKDTGCGRRIKLHHIKSLLKSKHDLEKAFCLNVEKQDKINELKLLVLQQQKCIRSLQEKLIEEQAMSLVHRKQGTDNPNRELPQDHNHSDTATDPGLLLQQPNEMGVKEANDNNKREGKSFVQNDAKEDDQNEQIDRTSDPGGVCSQSTLAPGHIRVEDMAQLQDVLYCDHGQFALDQSKSPEIAAMQVYGIGGEDLSNAVTNTSPSFNMRDLKYVTDMMMTKSDGQDNLGLDTVGISKSEPSKLASGDTL